MTRAVLQEVDESWPGHFGQTEGFDWPVTRAQALEALDDFVSHRLPVFGPFEDAMVDGEDVLYHSLLSVPLNLGLLHPLEVCQRALDRAADPANDIGLASIEGYFCIGYSLDHSIGNITAAAGLPRAFLCRGCPF